MFLPNGFEVQPMQVQATLHKNLIITLIITLPFGNSSYFSNSQFFMHWSEWEIRQDFFFCPKTLWVLKPPTISPVQTQYISNMPAESMQPGDHWKALRFHTHANYVHLCWKATALARRRSDSIRIFFFELAILTASLYWGSEGFPCRFHCVCTQLLCNMGSF